jgi:hypothetical protein
MLARTATAKVPAPDDNGILAIELAILHVARRIKRIGQAVQSIAAKLDVFLFDGRNQVEELRRDDLVGVDVVAHHINGSGKNRLHSGNC